jgi:hypothetical protein
MAVDELPVYHLRLFLGAYVWILDRFSNAVFGGDAGAVEAALAGKNGTGPVCAKPGTKRRLVAGRSGKLNLSPFSPWFKPPSGANRILKRGI